MTPFTSYPVSMKALLPVLLKICMVAAGCTGGELECWSPEGEPLDGCGPARGDDAADLPDDLPVDLPPDLGGDRAADLPDAGPDAPDADVVEPPDAGSDIEIPEDRPAPEDRPTPQDLLVPPPDALPTGSVRPPARNPSGGAGGPPVSVERTMESGPRLRSYRIHVPGDFDPSLVYGLAVVLHDVDGDTEYLVQKWIRAAGVKRFIVVLPNAIRGLDGKPRWEPFGQENIDFISDLVELMERLYNIELDDTLLVGLGEGASFATTAARVLLDTVDSLIAVNADMWERRLEQSAIRVYLVEGRANRQDLTERFEAVENVRYRFLDGLERFYPGPAPEDYPDDPGVYADSDGELVFNEMMVDWLWRRWQ